MSCRHFRLAAPLLATLAIASAACSTADAPTEVAGTTLVAQDGTTQPPLTQPPPADWQIVPVDLDGRPVHLACAGEGATVVIFLTDAGLATDGWLDSTVPDRVAAETRACVYDRASIGKSPASEGPTTVEAQADELAALLTTAGIDDPVVLVAHGYGAFVARVFAANHTLSTAAMVLVDPPLWELEVDPLTQGADAAAIEAINANMGGYGAAALPLPPVPVVVIAPDTSLGLPTRPLASDLDESDGIPPELLVPAPEERHLRQENLARKSPFGRFEVQIGSGPAVQFWYPEVVAEAVFAVLADPNLRT